MVNQSAHHYYSKYAHYPNYPLPHRLRRFLLNSSWYDLPTGTS
jgi:hypothetical protein